MTKKNAEEILKLSVQEATEALLMSQSSVYSWIERGRFKTEELPSGRVIVISKNEAEKIKEYNLKSRRNKVSKQPPKNSDNLQENSIIDAEFTGNYEENVTIQPDASQNTPNIPLNAQLNPETLKLVELVSSLSAKAGKYELLEDIQKQRENDLEYWKNQYFELKAENDRLKSELQTLRSRSLFSFFTKKF